MSKPGDYDTTLKLSEFLPYRLSVLSNVVSSRIARLYEARFDLSIPQWRVMAVVAQRGALCARDISTLTRMDKVTVSRAARSLCQRGLLKANVGGPDLRYTRYSLSRKGGDLYREIVPLALAEEREIMARLSPHDRTALLRLLDKLAEAAAPGDTLW